MKDLKGRAEGPATGCSGRTAAALAIVAGLASVLASAAARAEESLGAPATIDGKAGREKATRLLRPAAFRGAAPRNVLPKADDAAVLLRMTAAADPAVPVEDLDDALLTTGSVTPDRGAAKQLSAVVASLLPVPPAAPVPATILPVADDAVAPAGESGHILANVKMRVKPDNAAAVVSVLATQAAVTVLNCDYWCEIDAGGKRGFVFRKFVGTDAPSGERAAEKQEP